MSISFSAYSKLRLMWSNVICIFQEKRTGIYKSSSFSSSSSIIRDASLGIRFEEEEEVVVDDTYSHISHARELVRLL